MLIMAIDPGKETGLVLGQTEEETIQGMSTLAWDNCLQGIEKVVKANPPDLILIESVPPHHPDPAQYHRVMAILTKLNALGFRDNLTQVFPGTWKPVAHARKRGQHPEAKNQHERDAYGLWWWWNWYQDSSDKGYAPVKKVRRKK